MARGFRLGVPFAAAAVLAGSLPLLADSGTKITIRGSGSQVSIERTPAPARPPAAARRLSSSELVKLVAQEMAAGRSDAELVADLRARQFELPLVIGAGDLVRLKQGGVGDPVITYLSHVTAVDIGPTSGEGHESSAVAPAAPAPTPGFASDEAYVSGYGAGYGYGGYGGGYGGYPVHPAYRAYRVRHPGQPIRRFPSHPMPVPHQAHPVRRPHVF